MKVEDAEQNHVHHRFRCRFERVYQHSYWENCTEPLMIRVVKIENLVQIWAFISG